LVTLIGDQGGRRMQTAIGIISEGSQKVIDR
jgi:hypothetical protein